MNYFINTLQKKGTYSSCDEAAGFARWTYERVRGRCDRDCTISSAITVIIIFLVFFSSSKPSTHDMYSFITAQLKNKEYIASI